MQRANLILHPIRFRILQALAGETLTTQDFADRLPDVPKPSIYRHLRLLREGGMVVVAGVRPIRGVVEKAYRLNQPMRLGVEDMARLSPDDHVRFFQNYAMTLIQGFSDYVHAGEAQAPIDLMADRVGYTEAFLYATLEEFDQFATALNAALLPLLQNQPAEGRRKRKLAIITHPAASGPVGESPDLDG
jgi:DNA-binding transcriptional ArsR family regulator